MFGDFPNKRYLGTKYEACQPSLQNDTIRAEAMDWESVPFEKWTKRGGWLNFGREQEREPAGEISCERQRMGTTGADGDRLFPECADLLQEEGTRGENAASES